MAVKFEDAAHQYHYEHVRACLEQIAKGVYTPDDEHPCFDLRQHSAIGHLWVFSDAPPQWATVSFRCWVVKGARVDEPALVEFLIRKNTELNFGGFSIDSDGDIALTHVFPDPHVQPEELATVIHHVLTAADRYDDEIIARWGGEPAWVDDDEDEDGDEDEDDEDGDGDGAGG